MSLSRSLALLLSLMGSVSQTPASAPPGGVDRKHGTLTDKERGGVGGGGGDTKGA